MFAVPGMKHIGSFHLPNTLSVIQIGTGVGGIRIYLQQSSDGIPSLLPGEQLRSRKH